MFFPLRPGYNYKIKTDLSAFPADSRDEKGALMKAFIICLCYAAGLGVLSFFLGRLLPKRWLHPDKFPFRTYAWEEKLWKALQIRKWQAKVPDMSRLFKKLMPAKALTQKTAQDLPIMIQETCVAELTHGLLCFAGLALLKIWRGPGGVILTVIYIVFGNLPFLLIQRYNRPRLQRLLEKQSRRANRKEA